MPPSQQNKSSRYHPYVFNPTKKFTLTLMCRSSWRTKVFSDGKQTSLDLKLREVVNKLQEFVWESKLAENEKQLEQLRRESKRKREESIEMERAREKEKESRLLMQIENWQKARLIRAFTKSCIKRALLNPKKVQSIQSLSRWARWNLNYADCLDPVDPSIEPVDLPDSE